MGLGAGLLAHDLALEVREVAFFGLVVVERLEDLREVPRDGRAVEVERGEGRGQRGGGG